MRVALFVTCLGDTLFPETPKAVVRVLERLGHEVVVPREQTCCGQLHANSGYRHEAAGLAVLRGRRLRRGSSSAERWLSRAQVVRMISTEHGA